MCARLDTTGLLADVMYAISRGDTQVGRERCCLYRRASGGHWMTSEVELTRPFLLHQYVEIQAGADWRIESVNLRLSGHIRRDATHIADGGTWRATIQSDEATVERSVPFTRETLVEFDAVWACAIAIHRLPLTPGQSREVDVIRIEPASLEPMPARWRYECIGSERITTPAGKKNATHFVCGEDHLWADSRGIIVATHNAVSRSLWEYHWLG